MIRDLTFQISFVSGFPLAIVAASLAVKQTGTKPSAVDNCWLTVEYGIIYWAFVTPVALVVLVSTLRFSRLIAQRFTCIAEAMGPNLVRALYLWLFGPYFHN